MDKRTCLQPHEVLNYSLVRVAVLQTHLAITGWCARGGAARGVHYEADGLIFSPALLDAHGIQDNDAKVPRVVLSRNVADAYRGVVPEGESPAACLGRAIWPDVVCTDQEDQRPFVNYLTVCRWFDDAAESRKLLQRHKEAVEYGLRETRGDSRARRKQEWLAAYHNRFCRTELTPGEAAELLIQRR